MILETKQLYFDYPTQTLSKRTQPLLSNVSWQLPPGGILHIHGANGSGKTTLLKLLAGILQPSEGDILHGEHSIYTQLEMYQHNLCYLGHKTGISQALTVMENCFYDLGILNCTSNTEHLSVMLEPVLRKMALWDVKALPCHVLSAGQKRRVSLVRLMLSRAKIWLLDEPLVALDDAGVTLLIELLQQHIASNGQVVYSSHQPLPWIDVAHQVYAL